MAKLLIIEDDKYLAAELRHWLQLEKHVVDVSETGEDGIYRLMHFDYDLAIVDWSLPDLEGTEICMRIRKVKELSNLPLLMLTSRKDLCDKIEGLDSGAMDYVVKPCPLKELSARIRSLLRRFDSSDTKPTTVSVANLKLLVNSRQVFCAENILPLPASEYDILLLLIKNQSNVVDYRSLAEATGNVDTDDNRSLRNRLKTHVSSLRKKLQEANAAVQIENRDAQGYELTAVTEGEQ